MNPSSPFSLMGKKILVTGASSGIGRAIAIECSKAGAEVVITARNEKRLEETLAQIRGGESILLPADLTKEKSRKKLLELTPELDGIVHCAGIVNPLLFQFISEEKLKDIFEINFFSPVLLTKELIKAKKIINEGSIVFISSIAGNYCSSIGGSMYSASKAAINGMTKGMALDLSNKRIRVNTICPGMIETNIFEESGISKEQLETDILRYPMKRYGTPEEIGYAAIYLLSNASKWITGSDLVIDGGFTLL